jgi:hypothetical protein
MDFFNMFLYLKNSEWKKNIYMYKYNQINQELYVLISKKNNHKL